MYIYTYDRSFLFELLITSHQILLPLLSLVGAANWWLLIRLRRCQTRLYCEDCSPDKEIHERLQAVHGLAAVHELPEIHVRRPGRVLV